VPESWEDFMVVIWNKLPVQLKRAASYQMCRTHLLYKQETAPSIFLGEYIEAESFRTEFSHY
jgi:hypothetical protein